MTAPESWKSSLGTRKSKSEIKESLRAAPLSLSFAFILNKNPATTIALLLTISVHIHTCSQVFSLLATLPLSSYYAELLNTLLSVLLFSFPWLVLQLVPETTTDYYRRSGKVSLMVVLLYLIAALYLRKYLVLQ